MHLNHGNTFPSHSCLVPFKLNPNAKLTTRLFLYVIFHGLDSVVLLYRLDVQPL